MKTTEAFSCSSMSAVKTILATAIAFVLISTSAANACGPGYREWYHIQGAVPFDPLFPVARDSYYLFEQFFPISRNNRYDRRARSEAVYAQLTETMAQHRPQIVVLTPGNYAELAGQYCQLRSLHLRAQARNRQFPGEERRA